MAKFIKVLTILYRRNFTKNVLMIVFMMITNFIMLTFVLFATTSANILSAINDQYFESLSVDVSRYTTAATNNELINVRNYERPPLSYMHALMEETGRFTIRPDYTMFFNETKLLLFDKVLANPLFITYSHPNRGIGINRTFYNEIKKEVALTEERFTMNFVLDMTFLVNNEVTTIQYEELITPLFIYDEPTYFSAAKLYIPQAFIDRTIGSIFINEGQTVNNYLLNINNDHELANLRWRCHFQDKAQLALFTKITSDSSDTHNGLELSADYLQKVASFHALYDYLYILGVILFIFVIVGSAVIYTVIAHTALLANLKQMALLSVLGAKRSDLYVLYVLLITFNFVLGLSGLLIIQPFLITLQNMFRYFLHLRLAINITIQPFIVIILGNYLFLLSIIMIIFLVNMRRPLLYLLIDA